jgi:hypothetical protein
MNKIEKNLFYLYQFKLIPAKSIYKFSHMDIYTYVSYTYIYVYIYIFIHIYACTYIYRYIDAYIYIYIYILQSIYMYTYSHIYVCIYTNIPLHLRHRVLAVSISYVKFLPLESGFYGQNKTIFIRYRNKK